MSNRPDFKLGLPATVTPDDVDAYTRERGVPVLSVVAPVEPPKPKAAPLTKMALEVPDYLPQNLRGLAFERHCTVRFVVLDALAKAGIKIEPEDLVMDARRKPAK